MLSAGVESLEKRDFDAFSSSMSAVVQELYAGLPAALSAECPARVLGGNPEAFVLSCGGLPSEHQRTHGLSIRPSNPPERLDPTGKISHPGLMDLLVEEAGGPVREDGTHNVSAMKWDSLWAHPREGAGVSEGLADAAGEDSVLYPLRVEAEETCGPKEEETLLAQRSGESCSDLSCAEPSALLQNLEEVEAKEQRAPENLSDSGVRPQAVAADGTASSSETRGQTACAQAGVTLERSGVEAAMAKITVPGTDALPSQEPLSLTGDSLTTGQSQQEDECRGPTRDGALSAASDVVPSSEAGREKFLLCKDEEINTPAESCPPAQRDEKKFHEGNTSAPALESGIPVDPWLLDPNSEPSGCICGSNLTFENEQWEGGTDAFEVICETEEAGQFNDGESLKIELLEGWTSQPKMEESRSPTWSCEDLYDECEREMDHSYSCACKEDVETHKRIPVHGSSGKETLENSQLAESKGSLVTAANRMNLANSTPPLRELTLRPTREESPVSGTGGVEGVNHRLSPPPSAEGSATPVKGNQALLEDVSSLGCFRNSCTVSTDSHSPCHIDSSDCDPESGEGGVSQTAPKCNQKTEILEAFPALNLPPADSSIVSINLAPQEEDAEATPMGDGVFGGPASLGRLSGDGEFLGSHAKPQGMQGLSGLLRNREELESVSQNGSRKEGGETRHGAEVTLRGGVKRKGDKEDVRSEARSPSDPCLNDLCSVLELCCTVSGGLPFGDVPNVRTETNTEEPAGVETREISAPDRKIASPHACGGDSRGLAADSAPDGQASGSGSLNDEALVDETKNQWGVLGNTRVKAEGVADASPGVFAPRVSRGLTEDPTTAASDGTEATEAYEDGPRSQLAQKQTCEGDLGKTLHPAEPDWHASKGDEGGYRASPLWSSCSASDCSVVKADLNADSLGCVEQQARSLLLEDVRTKAPGQLAGTACQVKSQPLVNESYCVDEKDEVGILEWPPLPVMFSEKQKVDDTAQTSARTAAETQTCVSEEEKVDDVTRTVVFLAEKTQKFVSCPQNASTHVIGDQSLMPKVAAPVLSMEKSIQGTLQQSAINNCSSDKMVSELVRNSQNEESVELQSAQRCLGCAELASKPLKLNGFVQDQALQAKTDGFRPFSEANSDGLDKNPLLKISSAALSPGRTLFQPKPLTFGTSEVQERTERVHLDSRAEGERPHLVRTHPAAEALQNSERSQKGKPSALPSLETLSSSCVKEPPLETVLFGQETNDLINWPVSENEDGSSLVKEGTRAASPRFCKEIPVSLIAGKQGTEERASLLRRGPEPPKIPRSSEDDQREMNSAVEKTELPVPPCLDASDSTGTLLRDSIRPTGEGETMFPSEAETQMRQPCVCLLEDTSEPGFSRPKDPSETVVAPHGSLNVGSAWQTEGLFPTSSPEVLSKASIDPLPFGGILEASLQCLRREGRPLQEVEDNRPVPGVQAKPSVGQSVVLGLEAPVNKARASEVGGCLEFTQKQEGKETQTPAPFVSSCGTVSPKDRMKKNVKAKGVLKRRRILEVEHPFGGFSREMGEKRGGPAQQQTPAAGGRVDNMGSRNPQSNLWEPKRPKRHEGPVRAEPVRARSSGLCPSNGSWPPGRRGSPLLAFCTSGLSHSRSRGANKSPWRMRRHHLILRGQPEKASVLSRFGAPKQPPPKTSPAFLDSSSEIGPRPGCKLLSPTAFASVRSTRVLVWDQSLRQRGARASFLLDVFRPSKRAEEPALLRKVSALADKLLAPSRNAQKFKPLLSAPMPEKCSQLGSKALLELFSSVGTELNSQCVNVGSSCSFKNSNSPSFSLPPLESAGLCVLELSGKTPFAFGAPAFPAPFYVKTAPVPTRNLSGAKAPQSISHRSAWREMNTQLPSKWTFSFLLSQNATGIGPAPKEARALTPQPSARSDGKYTVAHDTPGLQTVLALFSPGCWCLWARKRHLPGQVLPTQRLTFLRFAGAWKDSNFSSADFFSSLPSTLDGRLPAWRGLDSPSVSPSEISPLCSPCCAWRQEVMPITTTSPPLQLRLGIQSSSSAMWPPVPDQSLEAPVARKDGIRWEPTFSASIPTSLLIPEPAWSHLGRSAPEFPVHPLDELDVSVPTFPQSNARREQAESEKKPKKVSQIRIRKTIPKPDPNLTPMGLPRPKRLKKTEFSLEEIYTNKNYKSPPATRSLETIFEEPKEKNGSLISISHQKRKRILEFQDFTIPRKRRARSRVKVMGGFTRAQKAALEGRELDVLLIQRLTDLEAFFAEQEELGDTPGS